MYLIPFHQVTGLEASEVPEIEPDTAVPEFPTTYTSDDDIILPEESDRVLSKAGSREEMVVEPEFVSDNMWQRTEVLAGEDGRLRQHSHVYIVAV